MKVPRLVAEQILLDDENVLLSTRQKRRKKMFNPSSLVITDKQLLVYAPRWVGYELFSYDYTFIQDVKATTGMLTSSVSITTMTGTFSLEGLPKEAADQVAGVVRERLTTKTPFEKPS